MDICFAAEKGGVGKSTLALHVAARLAQLQHDVAVVDLDRQRTSSKWARRTGYLTTYELADVAGLPDHEFRVFDAPGAPSADLRRGLARLCDVVVVVALVDLSSFESAVQTWHRFHDDGARAIVAVNQVYPTSGSGASTLQALADLSLPIIEPPVRRYNCYIDAQWDGMAVCDRGYPSADNAWSDICRLTQQIVQIGAQHGQQAA